MIDGDVVAIFENICTKLFHILMHNVIKHILCKSKKEININILLIF